MLIDKWNGGFGKKVCRAESKCFLFNKTAHVRPLLSRPVKVPWPKSPLELYGVKTRAVIVKDVNKSGFVGWWNRFVPCAVLYEMMFNTLQFRWKLAVVCDAKKTSCPA